jgi:uncharacterized protein
MSRTDEPRQRFRSTSALVLRKKRRLRSWKHRWRYFYLRFVRLKGTPEAIARGFAAGVFAGWFPLIATQMAFAILFATLIKGNKIVAAAGTWVSNPLTSIPIYAFNFHVGRWLMRSQNVSFSSDNLHSWELMTQLGSEFLTDLLVGCFVVGSICAICSYFICLWFVRRIRRRRNSH